MKEQEIKIGSLVRGYDARLLYGVGIVLGIQVFKQSEYFAVYWTGLARAYAGYLAQELELIP